MKDHNDTEDDPEWPSKKEGCKKTKTSSVILNGRRKNVYPATAVYLGVWAIASLHHSLLPRMSSVPSNLTARSIQSVRMSNCGSQILATTRYESSTPYSHGIFSC